MISPAAYPPAAYPPAPLDPIISRLRPRTVVEVLDQAFRLYRRHFLTFLAIIAVVHVPLQLLIQGVNIWLLAGYQDILTSTRSGSLSSTNETFGTIAAVYFISLTLSFLYGVLLFLSQGALTAAIADSHMDRPVGFGRAYRAMLSHIWPLLGWMVLQTLIVIAVFVPVAIVMVLGLTMAGISAGGSDTAWLGVAALCFSCFLLIPAMLFVAYVLVRLSAVVPAIVIENLGPVEAMRRSWRLVQNYWWRTVAILLVLAVMSWVIALGPAAVVTGIVGLVTRSFDQVMINAVSGVMTVITAAFFVPLQLTATTLYYFDLRVRKEGFDIESAMAQRYGQQGQQQPGFGGMQPAPAGVYGQATTAMGTPMLGYQQPADTRYLGYTPAPGMGYTPPTQGSYQPENYTLPPEAGPNPPEQSETDTPPALGSAPEVEQSDSGEETPRQG